MKWLIAPLIAAVLFAGSGFLSELQRTTENSVTLAEASREAPRSTAEAAQEVGSLPQIAELTGRQADAFKALADALDVSAQRVFDLNDSLDAQASDISELETGLDDLHAPIACARDRLSALLEAADGVPARLEGIIATLSDLMKSQEKSIRHLRSINRKLTAFGVVAEASNVEVPPPPKVPPAPTVDPADLTGNPCP